jgi:hypothetical protein
VSSRRGRLCLGAPIEDPRKDLLSSQAVAVVDVGVLIERGMWFVCVYVDCHFPLSDSALAGWLGMGLVKKAITGGAFVEGYLSCGSARRS